ncbi:MAG: two-component regulator propeller domain-containing protein [bacterium]
MTQYIHEIWNSGKTPLRGAIVAILQNTEGYLWLATTEGLFRFDGISFKQFNTKNTPALTTNKVTTLAEDQQGHLWIGTETGLVEYAANQFTTHHLTDGNTGELISALVKDSTARIYIWIDMAGLYYREGNQFVHVNDHGVAATARVRGMSVDQSGSVWLATLGQGVIKIGKDTVVLYSTQNGLPTNLARAINFSRDGCCWIGTQNGLARMKGGTITRYDQRNGLSNEIIRSVFEDSRGTLWVGTSGGGINRFINGKFESFTSLHGFSNDFVHSIYEDREGTLWIGTADGLNQFKDGVFTTYTNQEGLTNDVLWCVYEDRQGQIWAGTNGGGLNCLKGKRFISYTTKDGLASNVVRSVYEDRQGDLWIGTYGNGINRIRGGKVIPTGLPKEKGPEFAFCFLEDRSGNLWIGDQNGLYRWNRKALKYYSVREGLGAGAIRCLLEDHLGALWVGTHGGGLSRFDGSRFSTFTISDGLPSNIIMALSEDSIGELWIGTYGKGLVRYRNGGFSTVTSNEGLNDDIIYHIMEDNDGRVWLNGDRGISSVAKSELNAFFARQISSISSVTYGKGDGLQAIECNGGSQPSAWKTRDGRLLFATVRGIAVYNPHLQQKNTPPPPVSIEYLKVSEREEYTKNGTTLAPGNDRFYFGYSALSYTSPSRQIFQYRLEGYDRTWIEAGSRREAFYTNIPPGEYTFRVIAANESGVWNEEGASFTFSLEPYFYQRTIFYVLCAIGVVGLSAALYFWRTRHLVRQNKLLEARVEEGMKEVVLQKNQLTQINTDLNASLQELEEQSKQLEQAKSKAEAASLAKGQFLANVSHELRTPMNSIIGFTALLRKNKPQNLTQQDLNYIDRILENAKHLLSLMEEVLDLSRIESGKEEVQKEILSLNVLVQETLEQLEGRVVGKKVLLKCEFPHPDMMIETDPRKFRQILINLVENGIKFTEQGSVLVRVGIDPATQQPVRVDVVDTGIGISQGQQKIIFEPFEQADGTTARKYSGTGLGLSISKKLCALLGYQLTVASDAGKGATFSIILTARSNEILFSESPPPAKEHNV